MNTIELFKNDLWNGISVHAKKMIKPTLVFAIMYYILILLVMVVFFSLFLDLDKLMEMRNMYQGFTPEKFQEIQRYNLDLVEDLGIGAMIGFVISVFVVALLVGSWFLNLMLICSEEVIVEGQASIGRVLKKSFNKNILRILGASIILFVLYMLGILAASLLAKIHPILTILGIVVVLIGLLRFIAAPGAIVHGDMGSVDALSYSWKNINFGRGGKVFIALIVVFVIMLLVALVQGAIAMMATGVVGEILGVLIQLGIAVIAYAFLYSALSAAFYRYAEVEFESDESTHLVDDNPEV